MFPAISFPNYLPFYFWWNTSIIEWKGAEAMASADIRAMISAKQEKSNNGKKLVLKDIHRNLIIALTALPVYGKEVRDEEILTIIINGGVTSTVLERIRDHYNARLKSKELKKVKGEVVDADGYRVLVPR